MFPAASLTETQKPTIEAAFKAFSKREDIAVILINQHVCTIA